MMRTQSFLATVVAGFARLLTGATSRYFGEGPTTEQRIYFANHSSHMDFVVLWSSLPKAVREKARPVAAADYWSSGLRRRLACDVFHAVLVERSPRTVVVGAPSGERSKAIQPLIDVLEEGDSLILFPEGTRGDGVEIARFKSGIYNLCIARPGLKLVPVYLENLNRVLPKGEVLAIPMICHLSFGTAIQLREGEEREAFLVRARAALCALRGI